MNPTPDDIIEFIYNNKTAISELGSDLGVKKLDKGYLINIIAPICQFFSIKRKPDKPIIVSFTGGQGSGKTTMAKYATFFLKKFFHLRTISFSLDDIYLSKNKREKLAKDIHPLCKTRGVPGTHDVKLGIDTILSLVNANDNTKTDIPSFSKLNDDVLPRSAWERYNGKPDIILFDGWCSGLRPIEVKESLHPINRLERKFDQKGIWAEWSYKQLSGKYQDLFGMFDYLIFIALDNMKTVFESRWLQEKSLLIKKDGMHDPSKRMTKDQVYDFVMHFERISMHVFEELPKYSDFVLKREKDFYYKIVEAPNEFDYNYDIK